MIARNPYLFVIGCPRSGTTLLQRMLDNHPALTVINESYFIPRAINDLLVGPDYPLTAEIVSRARSSRSRSGKTGFFRLGLPEEAVDEVARKAHTYSQFVSELYNQVARLRGKPLAGEKTPHYTSHLRLLHGLFPDTRFIHIIRDGRSVALSLLEWAAEGKGPARYKLWALEPVAMCALWWRWQVGAGRRDGQELASAHYQEVRYEELVDSPLDVIRDVTHFLGLPYDPLMLRYYEGRVRTGLALSAKEAWLPPTPGLRDWRKQMPAHDVELFEALAGDLLSELGYERAFQTISPAVQERAERYRDWWKRKLVRRDARKAAISEAIAAGFGLRTTSGER